MIIILIDIIIIGILGDQRSEEGHVEVLFLLSFNPHMRTYHLKNCHSVRKSQKYLHANCNLIL